jgi:DNA-binding response OmpR family regulator
LEATRDILHAGPLELHPADFLALGEGRLLSLTRTEFALLAALAQRAGRIVARDELYEAVWERELPAHDRSVDVYVRKLRTKLADALPGWRFIHTHVRLGYRFFPEPSQLLHMTRRAR